MQDGQFVLERVENVDLPVFVRKAIARVPRARMGGNMEETLAAAAVDSVVLHGLNLIN